MSLPLDISALPGEVQREFVECRHTREVAAVAAAEARQEQVGAGVRALGDRRSVEGLGAPIAEIHPLSYHYWGQRLGYACWHDRGFVREYLRDVPAARVKAGGTKVQVGYAGAGAGIGLGTGLEGAGAPGSRGRSPSRFSKNYGAAAGKAAVGR